MIQKAQMIPIALALGTNMGVRIRSLQQAVQGLSAFVQGITLSSIYETPPAYVTDQPYFYNMALTGRTELGPEPLLETIKKLEYDIGRRQTLRYGPRVIDIDILFYDQQIVDLPSLVIPHALMHEREFVLRPLNDVAPDWQHPRTGATVTAMLAQLDQNTATLVGQLTMTESA